MTIYTGIEWNEKTRVEKYTFKKEHCYCPILLHVFDLMHQVPPHHPIWKGIKFGMCKEIHLMYAKNGVNIHSH